MSYLWALEGASIRSGETELVVKSTGLLVSSSLDVWAWLGFICDASAGLWFDLTPRRGFGRL